MLRLARAIVLSAVLLGTTAGGFWYLLTRLRPSTIRTNTKQNPLPPPAPAPAPVITRSAASPTRASGTWSVEFLYGDAEIFPSALMSVAAGGIFPPKVHSQRGDDRGLIAAVLESPSDDCPVTVTLGATAVFEESSVRVVLRKRGETYRIAPTLRLKHRQMFALKHPLSGEVLRVTVRIGNTVETKTSTMKVHAINDCLMNVKIGDQWFETGYLAAAYVNENNPLLVSRVIRDATARFSGRDGFPAEIFTGYGGGAAGVRRQVEALYRTLQEHGFHFTSMNQSSVPSPRTRSQWMRQPADTIEARQANCVDGSVLFASLLLRLGLRPVLLITPSHVFLAVHTSPQNGPADWLLAVETTMIATQPFQVAYDTGDRELREHQANMRHPSQAPISLTQATGDALLYTKQRTEFYLQIDILEARAGGIIALAENFAVRR